MSRCPRRPHAPAAPRTRRCRSCCLRSEKATDHAVRSIPHQSAHLAHVRAAAAPGDLLLAGDLSLPDDGTALLLFSVAAPETIEAFARGDVYVRVGIVRRWWVRQWDVVAGKGLGSPPSAAG